MSLRRLKALVGWLRFLITARFLLLRARFLKHHRNLVRLECLCKEILKDHPRNYLANFYLARALYKQGRSEEAVEVYRKLPNLPGSKFFLDTLDALWALHAARRYDEAIAAGRDALHKLNSGSFRREGILKDVYLGAIHRIVGSSHTALGHYEEAIPHLQIACEIDKGRDPQQLRQLLQQCQEGLRRQQRDQATDDESSEEP